MPRLANMVGETGTVEIPVDGDEPLVVVYRRGVMTPRTQMALAAAQAGADDPAAIMGLCRVVERVVVSWNLTDEDGSTIGTDAESIADVDLAVLGLIMEAIGAEMAPDPLRRSGSSNGSSPRASSGPLPIGMAS